MKIFSLLLWWPIIGYIVIYVATFIHLIKAVMKGYDPTKYCKNISSLIDFRDHNTIISFIVGLYIWPYRLIQFLASIPDLYAQYDLKDDEEES